MRSIPWVLALLVCACPSSLRRPDDKRVNLTGTIYVGGEQHLGDPLGGAEITVTRASDGIQLATAVSSSTGGWLLAFSAEAGTRVVVAVRAPGLTPTFRGMVVGPYTDAQLSLALAPPEPLECADSECISASDDASLGQVSDNLVGSARAFDPGTETPKLVGLEQLRPLAVAWFQLDAGTDAGVDEGDEGDAGLPLLRIRVPFAAWRKLEDATPSNGSIDLNFLSLDEQRGTWSAQAAGWLESELGDRLPESALAAVRAGQFAGGVVAVAPVKSPGYWALALPAASPGCLTGKVEAEGQAAEGVLLSLDGAESVATKSDGSFCLSAPVAVGGALGVQYAGLGYLGGGAVDGPSAAGSCGGSCTAVATVKISGEQLDQAKVCKISGTVIDAAGATVAGAVVLGFDDSLGGNNFNALCGKLGTRCSLSTSADDQGAFSLSLPLLNGVTLSSTAILEQTGVIEASRRGTLLLRECPTASVQVRLSQGRDKLDPTMTLTGNAIAWAPTRPAVVVRAIDSLGALKWEVQAPAGLAPPLTYGVVPAGAVQLTPATGSPAALATGDEVSVVLEGTGTDGYQYSGSAGATVP